MPKSDSFNARVRGHSHIDFKTATTGVAAKAMRNEISNLVKSVSDPQTKAVRVLVMHDAIYTDLHPPFIIRLSTLRCNPSSTSLLVTSQSALKPRSCT